MFQNTRPDHTRAIDSAVANTVAMAGSLALLQQIDPFHPGGPQEVSYVTGLSQSHAVPVMEVHGPQQEEIIGRLMTSLIFKKHTLSGHLRINRNICFTVLRREPYYGNGLRAFTHNVKRVILSIGGGTVSGKGGGHPESGTSRGYFQGSNYLPLLIHPTYTYF